MTTRILSKRITSSLRGIVVVVVDIVRTLQSAIVIYLVPDGIARNPARSPFGQNAIKYKHRHTHTNTNTHEHLHVDAINTDMLVVGGGAMRNSQIIKLTREKNVPCASRRARSRVVHIVTLKRARARALAR